MFISTSFLLISRSSTLGVWPCSYPKYLPNGVFRYSPDNYGKITRSSNRFISISIDSFRPDFFHPDSFRPGSSVV